MKITFTILILFTLFSFSGHGQSRTYLASGAEMIFSFANIKDQGVDESSILRWAPVINLESFLNRDLNRNFGLFTGIGVRNVGYIYDNYTDPSSQANYKKKFRSYNVGIPLGVKIGDLDNFFFYGGYEVEFPFLYKEKTIENGDKTNTITGWFSHRQELVQHGFLVGFQLPRGLNVKFKYYLSEFHNQNYTDAFGIKPYAGLESNIFYFSLNFPFFRNKKYITPIIKNTEYAAR